MNCAIGVSVGGFVKVCVYVRDRETAKEIERQRKWDRTGEGVKERKKERMLERLIQAG